MTNASVRIYGAGWDLLQYLSGYSGEKKVLECLFDGPRGTSKTVSAGWMIRTFMNLYPGSRQLYVRKTRASITQAFCPDFERIALEHDPKIREGPSPENRLHYTHPENGSTLVLAGLDNPGKIYSTNWDIVWADEAAQFTETELVDFYGVLRQWTPGMNFQALICMTNPRGPTHHLIQRWRRGLSKRFVSKHHHNPKWYDPISKTWSPEGKAFIEGLRKLPGALYDRNYLGLWKSAEGAVWAPWDDEKHVVAERPAKPLWRAAAMDWGYTDPCSLVVGEKDENGKITLCREVYRKSMSIEWWAQEVLEARRDLDIRGLVVDPSRPEIIDYFNGIMRSKYPRDSVPFARGADNTRSTSPGSDLAGIDLVRHYIEQGKLVAWKDRLRHHPDPELAAAGKPLSFTEEVPEYVYWRPRGEEDNASAARDRTDPRCADHACDAVRYLITFMHNHDLGDARPAPPPAKPVNPDHEEIMRTLGIL